MSPSLLLAALLASTDVSIVVDAPVVGRATHPLVHAEEALIALDFRGAHDLLSEALQVPNNDRATLVRIVELRALTAAALKDEAVASESFRTLLTLRPDYELPPEHAPRIRELYDAVRTQLSSFGQLHVSELPDRGDGNLRVRVENDRFELARAVRVYFVRGDWTLITVREPVVGRSVAVSTPSTDLQGWWAELLGEHDAVLLNVGNPGALRPVARPLTVARFELLVPGWTPAPPPPPAPPPRKIPTLSWSLWGGAAGALLASGVMGALAESQRRSVLTSERDASGRIVGMSQREAFFAQQTAGDQSRWAAVGVATSLGLAAAGSAVWWWDFSFAGAGK